MNEKYLGFATTEELLLELENRGFEGVKAKKHFVNNNHLMEDARHLINCLTTEVLDYRRIPE